MTRRCIRPADFPKTAIFLASLLRMLCGNPSLRLPEELGHHSICREPSRPVRYIPMPGRPRLRWALGVSPGRRDPVPRPTPAGCRNWKESAPPSRIASSRLPWARVRPPRAGHRRSCPGSSRNRRWSGQDLRPRQDTWLDDHVFTCRGAEDGGFHKNNLDPEAAVPLDAAHDVSTSSRIPSPMIRRRNPPPLGLRATLASCDGAHPRGPSSLSPVHQRRVDSGRRPDAPDAEMRKRG